MDFERTKRRVQEVNLPALIDIVFHLMVFVMLTTTFVVSESMELSLPSDKGKTSAASSGQVMRILIQPDGVLQLDAQAMSEDALNATLAQRLAATPDAKIAIFTTPGVNVQQLVKVMDIVYLTGGHNVQVDKAG